MVQKKRVVCFYRVSTNQQVVDDDIPMQRSACKNYIKQHPDWEFVGEYIEKGVSGFKVHASKREKLEELKEGALKKKFDVILVYMYDRLGRIEEETPFILKWFVEQGIEMWSVSEGQRKFEEHVDNLLNYITFWQASGESKKTQARTKEAKALMRENSEFQGSEAPYGYRHVSTGEYNHKDKEIKKLIIDETQARVVRRIFNYYTLQGYGSRKIAQILNSEKIPTKRGKKWAGQTILTIIKNSIYKGRFTYGRKKDGIYKNQYDCELSDIKHENLVIVSEKQWKQAKNIVMSRGGSKKTNIPHQTKSPLLFTGYIYCSECGERMTLKYSYNHYQRKDGTWNRDRKPFYQCYGKTNGMNKCSNKYHSQSSVEDIILKQLFVYMDSLGKINVDDEFKKQQDKLEKLSKKEIDIMEQNISKLENIIKILKDEIVNVLMGTSKFTEELLTEQIKTKTDELNIEREKLENYSKKAKSLQIKKNELISFKESIPTYRQLLENADIPTKKMILPKFINKVEVGIKDINVTFNVKIKELSNVFNIDIIEKHQHNV